MALNTSQSPWHLAWMAALLFLAITYGGLAIFGPGIRHLAFQTSQVQASVVDHSLVGECKSGDSRPNRAEYRLTLRWVDDQQERTGDYTTCDDLLGNIGDPVEVWVTGGGEVAALDSPLRIHLLALILPGLVLVVGSVAAIVQQRSRRTA